MFKKGKYSLIVNKNKIVPEFDHTIKNGTWTHVAVSLSSKDKTVRLFNNGKMIVNLSDVEVNLKKIGKTSLMVFPEFTGRITEIRLWKRAKDLEDVKSNMTTPLSIVSEQTAMIIISIKNPNDLKSKTAENALGNDTGIDFGNINDVQPKDTAGFDNWNFGSGANAISEDDWGNGTQKTKVHEKNENRKASAGHEKEQRSPKSKTTLTEKVQPLVQKSTTSDHNKFSEPLVKGPSNDTPVEENAWGINIPEQQPTKVEIDGWGIKVEPTEIQPKLEAWENASPPKELKVTSEKTTPNPSRGWTLFKSRQFQPAMYFDENVDHYFASQFTSVENPNAFQQKLSSLLLNVVKKCRTLYLREDFSGALKLVDQVFKLFKDVIGS